MGSCAEQAETLTTDCVQDLTTAVQVGAGSQAASSWVADAALLQRSRPCRVVAGQDCCRAAVGRLLSPAAVRTRNALLRCKRTQRSYPRRCRQRIPTPLPPPHSWSPLPPSSPPAQDQKDFEGCGNTLADVLPKLPALVGQPIKDAVNTAANQVSDGAGTAIGAVKDAATTAGNAVKDAATTAGGAVADTAEKAGGAIAGGLSDAGHAITSFFG